MILHNYIIEEYREELGRNFRIFEKISNTKKGPTLLKLYLPNKYSPRLYGKFLKTLDTFFCLEKNDISSENEFLHKVVKWSDVFLKKVYVDYVSQTKDDYLSKEEFQIISK